MKIVRASEQCFEIYLNLAQNYEAEFSAITRKKPDAKGLFKLDTPLGDGTMWFLLFIEGTPAGLAAVIVKSQGRFEVGEFYIVPCFRKQALGKRFAHELWRMYPGQWEVKQIHGAAYASIFWRRVISDFTKGVFAEDSYEDPYWGLVTMQRFVAPERIYG